MEKQLIISVGREFGSGGHEVAQKLADDYGIALYDHDLLKEIAAKKNLKSEDLEAYDELKWNRFLYRTVRGLNSSPEQNVANLQFDFLKEKAKSGESFVVVGRCSETILREYESMVSIFIRGDKEKKEGRFPVYQTTERPDRAAQAILEGRVVLLTDNSPEALIFPATLNSLFQTADDYYRNERIVTFLRLIRYVAAFLALALPGLYVAAATFLHAASAGQFDPLHGGGKKRRAVSDGSGSPSDGTVL